MVLYFSAVAFPVTYKADVNNILFGMEEEVPSGSDNIVTEFNTYEDFLDSQINSLDLYYLEVCCCGFVVAIFKF